MFFGTKCRLVSPPFVQMTLGFIIMVQGQIIVYTKSLQFHLNFFLWVDAKSFQFSSIVV